MNFEWKFREMSRGEINVDPIEGEFFATEALGSLSDALVRESIQNSLDAKAGNGPVTVRFSFYSNPSIQSKSRQIIAPYFNSLTAHLRAKNSGLNDVPELPENMEYILIEDYGTRGLGGDIRQYDDLDDDVGKNDFYYFWRNIGRTRKGTTDLGRWGLGKTVFQAASRINSFFGMTRRAEDNRALLMGQSVLKIHKVDGRRYAPYGYYGTFKEALPLPIEDAAFLEKFSNHFQIDRNEKPGLSIMIPYPEKDQDEDIDPKEFIKSVIKHYFFPILSGYLIVEIRHDRKKYLLDATSLDELLKKSRFSGSQGMLGLLDLARWAIRQPEENFIRLKAPDPGRAPKLREHLFDEKYIKKIKEKFSLNQRLAFHIPITVQRQQRKEIMRTGFSVFLERDTNLDKAEDHFIRQGITIPEITSLKHKGIRAIVSITERDLSTFLGDAENPAHTEWERNSKKFKKKYKLGPSTLDYVKTSPRELVKILTQVKKGRDESLLRHIFSLPVTTDDLTWEDKKKIPGKGEEEGSEKQFAEVSGSNYLRLNPIKGGFSLVRKPKARKVPRFVTVWIAYEVRNGNPFKKYTPLDFDVDKPPIVIRGRGVRLLVRKENTFRIEVQRGDFKVTITGFDTHRDLRVKTIP